MIVEFGSSSSSTLVFVVFDFASSEDDAAHALLRRDAEGRGRDSHDDHRDAVRVVRGDDGVRRGRDWGVVTAACHFRARGSSRAGRWIQTSEEAPSHQTIRVPHGEISAVVAGFEDDLDHVLREAGVRGHREGLHLHFHAERLEVNTGGVRCCSGVNE